MHNTMTRTITRDCIAAFVGAFVFVARPPLCGAQTTEQRYKLAAQRGDFRGAAAVLAEALRDPTLSEPERRERRAAIAFALARAGDLQAATEAADAACVAPDAPAACVVVRQELARLAPPPPAVERGPRLAAREAAAPVPMAPPPVAAPSPVIRVVLTPTRSWTPSAGPVALWSIGAASLVTAGVLAALRADALGACQTRGEVASCPDTQSLDRARTVPMLSTGTNVALGIGASALVAGSLWYVFGGRAVVPTFSAEGATLAVSGRW